MIRSINKNDLALLIQVDLDDEGVTVDNTDLSTAELQEHKTKINTFITEEDRGGFVYEIDHTPVGVIMYSVENCDQEYLWPTPYQAIRRKHFTEDGQMLAVFQLWVDPQHRRKGIAYELKLKLEEEARSRNIQTLYTHTETHNQHVIDMNIKLGYTVVRIGPIWDNIPRVSLLKDLRKYSVDDMLKNITDDQNCLITAEQLEEQLIKKDVTLLDIRLKEAFDLMHLEYSIHAEWHKVYQLIDGHVLPQNQPIVVICYTGQSSMHIATLLKLKGYQAYSLLDGIEKWPYQDRLVK